MGYSKGYPGLDLTWHDSATHPGMDLVVRVTDSHPTLRPGMETAVPIPLLFEKQDAPTARVQMRSMMDRAIERLRQMDAELLIAGVLEK